MTHRSKHASVAVLGLTIGFVPAAMAQDISISGIKAGMTMAQAEAQLPGYAMHHIPTGPNSPFAITMASKGSADAYVIEAVDGKVAYVNHRAYYPQDQAFMVSNFVNKLVQKYGPQSPYQIQYLSEAEAAQRYGGTTAIWEFDLRGKLVKRGACVNFDDITVPGPAKPGPGGDSFTREISGLQALSPKSWPANYATDPLCGVEITASALQDHGSIAPGTMASQDLSLIDFHAFAAEGDRFHSIQRLKEQQEQQKLNSRPVPPT